MVNSVQASDVTPTALADAMLLLGANHTLRRAMGDNGRRLVEALYTHDAVTRASTAVFRWVLPPR